MNRLKGVDPLIRLALVCVALWAGPAAAEPEWRGRPEDFADGLKLQQMVRGDIDGDGRSDAAMVLSEPFKTPQGEAFVRRHLVVVRQTQPGRFRLAARSTRALLRADEGGVFGDPLQPLAIRNRVLIVSHYGGSNWRWSYTDRLTWRQGQLQYIGRTDVSQFTGDGSLISRDTNLSTGDVIVRRQAGAATAHTDMHRFHEVQVVPATIAPTSPTLRDWDAPVTRLRAGVSRVRVQACTVGDTVYLRVAGHAGDEPRLRPFRKGEAPRPLRRIKQGDRWLAAYPLKGFRFVGDDELDHLPPLALQVGAQAYPITCRRKKTGGALTLADCLRSTPPD